MAYTIDAHHHFWEFAAQEQSWRTADHGAIAADYGPADLRGHLAENGVSATVLVQSVDTPAENDRLAGYAERAPFVAGVVGWLPVLDPQAAHRELGRIRTPGPTGAPGLPGLCGVRCLVGRSSLDRLTAPDALELFAELAAAGLVWEVVPVTAEQAETVVRIAAEVPELSIVVDHLARPPLDGADPAAWRRILARLAARPNVALKVSVGLDVLTALPAWDGAALKAPVAAAVAEFGPQRLILAGNWPVVLLKASYARALADQTDALRAAGLSGTELAGVLGANAARWYGLALPRSL